MNDPRFEIDDPKYPEALQKAWIGYVFRFLHPFTDEDVAELTEYYRLLWCMREKPKKNQELISVLHAIKARKIKSEKERLAKEIKKLDEL